jgi:hypothetical protein
MPVTSSKPRVLQLNLAQLWFDQIASGEKRTEYREAKPYWPQRLEGRQYDLIEFRNGYATDAFRMLVEFRSLCKQGTRPSTQYAIRLGKIVLPPTRSRRAVARELAKLTSSQIENSKS